MSVPERSVRQTPSATRRFTGSAIPCRSADQRDHGTRGSGWTPARHRCPGSRSTVRSCPRSPIVTRPSQQGLQCAWPASRPSSGRRPRPVPSGPSGIWWPTWWASIATSCPRSASQRPLSWTRRGTLAISSAKCAAEIEAALTDPGRAEKVVSGMFGEQPFESLVSRLLCADTLIHTWDLARATGQPEALDPGGVREGGRVPDSDRRGDPPPGGLRDQDRAGRGGRRSDPPAQLRRTGTGLSAAQP